MAAISITGTEPKVGLEAEADPVLACASTTCRHLLAIEDLDRPTLESLIQRAGQLERGSAPIHLGPGMAVQAFLQSSTRTRMGFSAAAIACGLTPVDLAETRFSAEMSAAESWADTLRCVSSYARIVVLRHPDERALLAARSESRCPVINAGCGDWQHPTQTLADLYAIHNSLGRLDGLRVAVVGSPDSRSAHSLLRALRWFDVALVRLIAPTSLAWDPTWLDGLPAERIEYENELAWRDIDVVYMSGLPARVDAQTIDASERQRFALTPSTVSGLSEQAIVLCPLPRIDEIAPELDGDPRARWFVQSASALHARMAVLEWLLGDTPHGA